MAGWIVASSALPAQTYSAVASFGGLSGRTPYAGLVQGSDGILYGTTHDGGGASDDGTIFRIDTTGATLTTLYGFSGQDGSHPHAALIQAADGNFYGTTSFGGTSCGLQGCGTVFKIDANGTTLATLHSFDGNDGQY